jgi:hypothetical protein
MCVQVAVCQTAQSLQNPVAFLWSVFCLISKHCMLSSWCQAGGGGGRGGTPGQAAPQVLFTTSQRAWLGTTLPPAPLAMLHRDPHPPVQGVTAEVA